MLTTYGKADTIAAEAWLCHTCSCLLDVRVSRPNLSLEVFVGPRSQHAVLPHAGAAVYSDRTLLLYSAICMQTIMCAAPLPPLGHTQVPTLTCSPALTLAAGFLVATATPRPSRTVGSLVGWVDC